MTEELVIERIKKDKLVNKYLDGKKILKVIFFKNRIINFIVG